MIIIGFQKAVEDSIKFISWERIQLYSMQGTKDIPFHFGIIFFYCGNQFLEWRKNEPRAFRSEWDTSNVANFFSKGKDWERPANITLFENGNLGFSTMNTPVVSGSMCLMLRVFPEPL